MMIIFLIRKFVNLFGSLFINKLHEICNFRTDYEFITKRDMKTIQKKANADNKILYFKTRQEKLATSINTGFASFFIILSCQR